MESRLEEFGRALSDVISDFPDLSEAFEVLVGVRDERAASSFVAKAERCNPPCPPGQRCWFNPGTLKWECR